VDRCAARTEQAARTEAPSNPEPNDLPTADSAIPGRWSWRSQCRVFGSYHGDMTFTQSAKGLTGINTDLGQGDRREMLDARLRNETVSFRIKVDGGATQHWKGNLSRRRDGQYLLSGSSTDSRFSFGSCSWARQRTRPDLQGLDAHVR
jgi:hypothetical protein